MLLLSNFIEGRIRKIVSTIIWAALIVSSALMFCANHYFPRGPLYPTGDVVCQNDDRGPCAEQYVEDTRALDIPTWAKLFKGSGGELLIFGLLFAGIVVSGKGKKQ